ncbi:Hypothetical predicted protein [Octopus vulgaris]|uniref:Uncharacterized protein n=1 Tax=Octopus vulgaris TaxID=6645 RepID=A0AA36BCF0_OCTVU|nr:Hypothetical predicted protein [Octopus vulgaris]
MLFKNNDDTFLSELVANFQKLDAYYKLSFTIISKNTGTNWKSLHHGICKICSTKVPRLPNVKWNIPGMDVL